MKLPWFRSRVPLKPAAAAYYAAPLPRFSAKAPLDDITFVVLDAEATGFNPVRDRILSLAAVTVKGGVLQVASLRSWLVYHPHAPLTEAVHVHGIMPSDTRTGEAESDVLEQLLPLLTGAVLVGHHIGFDVGLLNAALQRQLRIKLRNPTLDTADLAMRSLEAFRKTGYAGQRVPSLDEVCTHCGIEPLDRHTAAGDAFTTAELLMVLCSKYARHLGRPLTVSDLPLEKA